MPIFIPVYTKCSHIVHSSSTHGHSDNHPFHEPDGLNLPAMRPTRLYQLVPRSLRCSARFSRGSRALLLGVGEPLRTEHRSLAQRALEGAEADVGVFLALRMGSYSKAFNSYNWNDANPNARKADVFEVLVHLQSDIYNQTKQTQPIKRFGSRTLTQHFRTLSLRDHVRHPALARALGGPGRSSPGAGATFAL